MLGHQIVIELDEAAQGLIASVIEHGESDVGGDRGGIIAEARHGDEPMTRTAERALDSFE